MFNSHTGRSLAVAYVALNALYTVGPRSTQENISKHITHQMDKTQTYENLQHYEKTCYIKKYANE